MVQNENVEKNPDMLPGATSCADIQADFVFDICNEGVIGEKLMCFSGNPGPVYIRYGSKYKEIFLKADSRELHTHNHYELVMVLDGNQTMNINNNIYMLKPGDVIVTRPGEPHFFTNVSLGSSEVIEINIPAAFFDNLHVKKAISGCFDDRDFCERNLISPNSEMVNSLVKPARKLISKLNTGEENQLLIYSYFIQYMYAVNEAFYRQTADLYDKNIPDILYSAISFIRRNLSTVQNLNEISDFVGVSVSYLCRIFKSHLEMSPHEYITNHRLEYAKALLSNNDMNVSQVCHKSGFRSYSGFIALFKKHYGMTPLAYKKSR